MQHKRVVVKVGSSSLIDEKGLISAQKMKNLVKQIAILRRYFHCQVVLVSSGAVAAGLGKLGWSRATLTLSEKQSAASVGQSLLIEKYQRFFAEEQMMIAQMLLTRADIENRKRFIHIRHTLDTLLKEGILPIVNENDTVTVDEIRIGDNDTLAGLVALATEADLLILLTDIDGLYTANPQKHAHAKLIPEVRQITPQLEQAAGGSGSVSGTGGMYTKLRAARIAVNSGIDMVIASSSVKQVLPRILSGERLGTRFYASHRLPSKKSWLAYGTRIAGKLRIDPGAEEALVHRAKSLLIAGIVEVKGDFQAGSVVGIENLKGEKIGKGMVNFGARDLRSLLRKRLLGEKLENMQEVIHRDALVVYQPMQRGVSCET